MKNPVLPLSIMLAHPEQTQQAERRQMEQEWMTIPGSSYRNVPHFFFFLEIKPDVSQKLKF